MIKSSEIIEMELLNDAKQRRHYETSTKDFTWKQVVSVNHRVVSVAERLERWTCKINKYTA